LIICEVRLGADGRVERIAQQVQACAFGQASAALVQRLGPARSVADVRVQREQLAAWLGGHGEAPEGFAVLAPARAKTGRHGAMLLPFDALIAALDAAARDPGLHRDDEVGS
jgi:NifU-like protein involved in Fe-S cluster formation